MNSAPSPPLLRFTGSKHLVQRLVLATLTGKPIKITKIRSNSHNAPGIAAHERSFCRLLDAITNGSDLIFSQTGTEILYKPGLITGSAAGHGASGGVIRHEVDSECTRGASYFIVALCLLAPFSKSPVNVIFTDCITSATPAGDISVDTVRTAILPLYKSFGIENNLELRILRRSNPSARGVRASGEVQLVFGHQVRLPKTIHILSGGRIKRVRGVAYATGVAGANNKRIIEAAKGVLNEFVSGTEVYSDVGAAALVAAPKRDNTSAKKKAGLGFGLSLVAESNTGALYSADVASSPTGGDVPEDLGKRCAYQLLEAIAHGGCVSIVAAPTMLTMMALGSEDVGRLAIGKEVLGSAEVMQLARDLRTFGMSGWGLKDGKDEAEVVISIVGRGVGNVGRKIA